MGINASTEITDISLGISNRVVDNVFLDITDKTNATGVISQNLKWNVINSEVNCRNGGIRQSANLETTALGALKSDNATQISNNILSKIEASAKQTSEQRNAGINLGQVNLNKQVVRISEQISNDIESNVRTTLQNDVNSVGQITQVLEVNWSGSKISGNDCTIDQNASLAVTASNLTDSINRTIIDNNITNELSADIEQANKQVNEGLFGCGEQCVQCVMIISIVIGIIMVAAIIGSVLAKRKKKNPMGEDMEEGEGTGTDSAAFELPDLF